jgi:hypothetical protein
MARRRSISCGERANEEVTSSRHCFEDRNETIIIKNKNEERNGPINPIWKTYLHPKSVLGPEERLDKEELIAIILDVATKEYRAILTIERKIKGDFLTIKDLERVMKEEYRQNKRKQQHASSDEGEMLLFQNQVTCYNCGKTGHCANECTSRRINNPNSKNYKNFKVNTELVDSVDTQQKTVGQERRTKVKGHPIGRRTQKKKWIFRLKRKEVLKKLLSIAGLSKT